MWKAFKIAVGVCLGIAFVYIAGWLLLIGGFLAIIAGAE
jgi:hypothetical protein